MKPIVFYHAHCTDGFGAAFAAWRSLGDGAEYAPVQYGRGALPDVAGRDVYILDFSFPREEMEALLRAAARVVWLDHHKSAFEMWCGGLDSVLVKGGRYEERGYAPEYSARRIVLDNNKSGALLAWEYFHPGAPVPALITRIDDRDRWVFKYDDSKAVHAGLALMQPWQFPEWGHVVDSPEEYAAVVAEGRAALRVHARQIEETVAHARQCSIVLDAAPTPKPVAVGLAVNCTTHISEVGHALSTRSGAYGLMWRYDPDTRKAVCSLRSDGDYDVSAIAKIFGGGGHKNAAGFSVPMQQLLEWIA